MTAPTQELRDRFANAIEANDIAALKQLISSEPLLPNADLRKAEERDGFTNGFPLYRACQRNHEELARLLLEQGADPNAASPDPDDQPELGMPLHFAMEQRNYGLANMLLDSGAAANAFPHCDQSTVERTFYQAREAGLSEEIVRRAYAKFLPDQEKLETQSAVDLVGFEAAEPIKLFARMVDAGGQLPFCAMVRDGLHALAMEIVQHCPEADGTPHDHPNASVFSNIFGAARWYGYPGLVRCLMDVLGEKYDYGAAITTIGVAIGSHNRDGGYPEYRQIIVQQLEHLKAIGSLEEAIDDPDFRPLYHMATDFTWHSNYGFRAEIAKPECYIDLAELFVSWGFRDINHRDPETGHSPLSAVIKRGHHPGIATYVRWLLENGAELREADPDEVNPKAIAKDKGHDELSVLLESFAN